MGTFSGFQAGPALPETSGNRKTPRASPSTERKTRWSRTTFQETTFIVLLRLKRVIFLSLSFLNCSAPAYEGTYRTAPSQDPSYQRALGWWVSLQPALGMLNVSVFRLHSLVVPCSGMQRKWRWYSTVVREVTAANKSDLSWVQLPLLCIAYVLSLPNGWMPEMGEWSLATWSPSQPDRCSGVLYQKVQIPLLIIKWPPLGEWDRNNLLSSVSASTNVIMYREVLTLP